MMGGPCDLRAFTGVLCCVLATGLFGTGALLGGRFMFVVLGALASAMVVSRANVPRVSIWNSSASVNGPHMSASGAVNDYDTNHTYHRL